MLCASIPDHYSHHYEGRYHTPDVWNIYPFATPDPHVLHLRPKVSDRLLGAGPRSSALVGGYTQQHQELEIALAELKGRGARGLETCGCVLHYQGLCSTANTVPATETLEGVRAKPCLSGR